MGKAEQRFTKHLALDEHIQWVTEEQITVIDTVQQDNMNIVIALIIMALFAGIFVTSGLIYQVSLFVLGSIFALMIIFRRTTIPAKSVEIYALTNKRILKEKSGQVTTLNLDDISTVRYQIGENYVRIEFVPDKGSILVMRDLAKSQAEEITSLLAENTSIAIPPLPEQ